MKYIVPAKTFLVGEYSALVGGSVLGLATGPGFEVTYSVEENAKNSFHPQSPAGILSQENQALLKNKKIEIADLFNNLGGFGRSTAEYLSVLIPLLQTTTKDFSTIRRQYQEITAKSGAKASGADLAIQYFGRVTVLDEERNICTPSDWKLKDHDFILVSTGQKIKTHEHISQIDSNRLQSFPKISNPIVNSYIQGSAAEFILGLKEWSTFLEAEGLTHPYSLELKAALQKNPDVICAKPCGAMGADVIAILCLKEKSPVLQQELLAMNLVIQGTSAELIPGVLSQLPAIAMPSGEKYVD